MLYSFPETTNARAIQRSYRKLFDRVKRTGKTLVVMRRNKPEVAIVDMEKYAELEAVAAVMRSAQQIKEGRAKLLTSLTEL